MTLADFGRRAPLRNFWTPIARSSDWRPQALPAQGFEAMARAGAEAKSLILLVTFLPQCVVSMLSMTPPVMASQIARSVGLSPQVVGVYIGLVYAGAILSSSFSAVLIARLGPLRFHISPPPCWRPSSSD